VCIKEGVIMRLDMYSFILTIVSIFIMILIWKLQQDNDKKKRKQDSINIQLSLLDRRNACFLVFRQFYSQMIKNGVCEDTVNFSLPSKNKLIELGYSQLFSSILIKLIDDFFNDALEQRKYDNLNNSEESSKLLINLMDRVKLIENQFNKESKIY